MKVKKKPSVKLIPIFSWFFAPFDLLIGEKSLTIGMKALKNALFGKNNVAVKGLTQKTKLILSSKPVIIVCNHPFDAEVILLLGSLPERKDVTMVGSDSQVRMGHEFAEYIIKVFTYRQEREGKNLKLSSRVARYTYRKSSGLSEKQMQKHNRNAITQAASKVNAGGLVVMFPQGTSSKIEWRPGVGYLISQLNLVTPTYLCMAYISNSSNMDFLRMIPGLNMILPRPTVTFLAPIQLKKSNLSKEPKEIMRFFENKYLIWIESLKNKT